ncbi:NAD-dependent epimerase/dehydratase family protein [Fodinibius halophilus]|uniref:NAD-dependent epimerase/dehydratase family protein n=1 Tax=Fodinibius halophilus TaxID=1736908 RepID=A0A6M1ST42_9BACT|nr:NAD-dependent epimerase/dehydratase family protein [Fodinibius halophilus]NGP87098.1 NAD-dependent epimerase/dehydratase family protein [Fodinibius halophilus]
MDVFITGATGYIGFNIATTFRRAGYRVYGLTRSEQKAQWLQQQEIIPVIGDMKDPDSYREIASQSAVIIHAGIDYGDDTIAIDQTTVDTLTQICKEEESPQTFIYTSGCWMHGNTGCEPADESTPINPIDIVQWRPEIEQQVLQGTNVNSLVLRPGCVYGKRGGMTGQWFEGAVNGTINVVGDGTNFWTMVHAEDLADAYLLAAESGRDGEVFDISDRSRYTVRQMAEAVAQCVEGDPEINYIPTEEAAKNIGVTAEAMAIDQHIVSTKTERQLGWKPNHRGFINDVQIYFDAWKAHQKD